MGEIVVPIKLENEHDRALADRGHLEESEVRRVTINAVADTGAMMLALPEDVVQQLGLRQVDTIRARYADGRREALPVMGPLSIRIDGPSIRCDCAVIPTGAEPLVGQIVMGQLDLMAGHTYQRFGPRAESPDRPLVRL